MNNQCPICNENFTPGFNVPKKLVCGHVVCLICAYHEIHTKGQYSCYSCDEMITTDRELRALPLDYSKYSIDKQGQMVAEIQRINSELMGLVSQQNQRSVSRNHSPNFNNFNDFQVDRMRRQVMDQNQVVTKNVGALSISKRGIFVEKSASNDFHNADSLRKNSNFQNSRFYSSGSHNSGSDSLGRGYNNSNSRFNRSGQIGFSNFGSLNRGFSSSSLNRGKNYSNEFTAQKLS